MNFLLTVGIIIFVLFILNAVFLGVIYFMRKRMAVVSQWPSTMGTVMTSELREDHQVMEIRIIQLCNIPIKSMDRHIKVRNLRRVLKWVAREPGRLWQSIPPARR